MKFFGIALVFLLTVFSIDAFAQIKPPDYSGWVAKEYARPYLLDGREVDLSEKTYEIIDIDKKLYKAVGIIHNENKEPWIMAYIIVPGEFLNEHGLNDNFSEMAYVFEFVNNNWKFKKKFDSDQVKRGQFLKYLKNNYNLEHR